MNFNRNDEPSAPPRRKQQQQQQRSLSVSRFDSQQQQQHSPYHYQPNQQSFQQQGYYGDDNQNIPARYNNNRMIRAGNYSEEHIPALYQQQQQQPGLIRFGSFDNHHLQSNQLITAQNYPPSNRRIYQQQQPPSQQQQQYYPDNNYIENDQENYYYNDDQMLLDYHQNQNHLGDFSIQGQPTAITTTTLINNQQQPSLLFAAMAGQPLTRFNSNPNGLNFTSPSLSSSGINRMTSSSLYARPHYDHHHNHHHHQQPIKSLQNIHYNPYQSKFNPTLMAKPSLLLDGSSSSSSYQSTQISTPITQAIATRRDPKYSSKEKLNFAGFNDSSSINHQNHQVRFAQDSNDTRTRTPPARPPPPKIYSKFSMENLSSTSPTSIGLNNDYAVIDKNRRDRRSLSPSRIVPPGGIQQRPYSSRPTSPLPLSSLTTGRNSPNYSPQQLSRSSSMNFIRPSSGSRSPSSREPSPIRTFMNLFSPKSIGSGSNRSKTLFSNENNNQNSKIQTNDSLQVPSSDTFQTKQQQIESELKNQSSSNHVVVNDRNFSKAFTDHCDQYKSVTSKILGNRKNKFTIGGDDNNDQSCLTVRDEDFQKMEEFMMNNNQEILFEASIRQDNNYPDLNVQPIRTNNNEKHFQNENPIQQQKQCTDNNNNNNIEKFATKLGEKLLLESGKLQRRNSSNTNLDGIHQRKASLPAEYIAATTANVEQLKLQTINNDDWWCRENVAQLAHKARERKLRPENQMKQKMKKIGIWFTRQFVFLLICAMNIAMAYLFYNLMTALP